MTEPRVVGQLTRTDGTVVPLRFVQSGEYPFRFDAVTFGGDHVTFRRGDELRIAMTGTGQSAKVEME